MIKKTSNGNCFRRIRCDAATEGVTKTTIRKDYGAACNTMSKASRLHTTPKTALQAKKRKAKRDTSKSE